MKILLSSLLTVLSLQLSASNWSLTDKDKGWNQRDLVQLYFHNSELQTQWAWEALSHYKIQGNEQILDFGSGDGKISSLMSYMVSEGSVTGIDLSKEMTLFASKMFPHKNLSFLQSSDVDFSSFELGKKFDLVTSFCVFHLTPNPMTIFSHLREIISNEGVFLGTVPAGGNPTLFKVVSSEMAKYGLNFPKPSAGTISVRTAEGLKAFLEASGFEIEHLELVKSRFPFSSKEELVDWFEGTSAANWNIPNDIRHAFFTAVTDQYFEECPWEIDEDGFCYFYLNRLDFVARPTKD